MAASAGEDTEPGESSPGVTNGIAVCLQALQLYDLVTKWHMVVLHAGLIAQLLTGNTRGMS